MSLPHVAAPTRGQGIKILTTGILKGAFALIAVTWPVQASVSR